ncbi:MAG: aldo/keto reductase [Bryobacterales bacterium]|nr:aldo/keto reductase [Bryobacteraceae bacterium]MDW8130558.1 aldo/keto reductase [Bryobacterales bacterium]
MRRRNFVGRILGALAGSRSLGSADVKPGDIPKRKFGKTGVEVSIIGMAGGRLAMVSREEARRVVRRAWELGINFFDNARSYWDGRAEEVFGEVLAPVRKEIFLTTKTTARSRKAAEAELEASLRALRTDYVDLWQVHALSEMKELEEILAPGGALEAFEAARKAGKCRFIGVTGHHDPEVLAEALRRHAGFDSVFMPLHAADPAFLSFERNVLPLAVARGLAIQAMKTFANARLMSVLSPRECLCYALSLPVSTVVVGAITVGQIEDDARFARDFRPLPAAEMEGLRRRAARVAGPALEDWKRRPA